MRNQKLKQLIAERKKLQSNIKRLSMQIAGEIQQVKKKNGNGRSVQLPHPVLTLQPS